MTEARRAENSVALSRVEDEKRANLLKLEPQVDIVLWSARCVCVCVCVRVCVCVLFVRVGVHPNSRFVRGVVRRMFVCVCVCVCGVCFASTTCVCAFVRACVCMCENSPLLLVTEARAQPSVSHCVGRCVLRKLALRSCPLTGSLA